MKKEFKKFCDQFEECEGCEYDGKIKGGQDKCYIEFLESKIDDMSNSIFDCNETHNFKLLEKWL